MITEKTMKLYKSIDKNEITNLEIVQDVISSIGSTTFYDRFGIETDIVITDKLIIEMANVVYKVWLKDESNASIGRIADVVVGMWGKIDLSAQTIRDVISRVRDEL